jgi:hypothetical protein
MTSLPHLLRVCSEATPGKWRWDPHDCSFGSLQDEQSHYVTVAFADNDRVINISDADARFVETFDPLLVGKLLAVVEAARAMDDDDLHPAKRATTDALRDALAALKSPA